MKIALLGYGKMGKEIEKIALKRGHTIVLKIENNDAYELHNVDIAIDFSVPGAVLSHLVKCFKNKIPVVSGTTGWLENYQKVVSICKENGGSFIYASNFSIGANIFFELNQQLSKIMSSLEEYSVNIEEIHHSNKLDVPSGTAITLAEGIIENSSKCNWKLKDNSNDIESNSVPILSKRVKDVSGIHIVSYASEIDSIRIKHIAKNRKGFALGAIIAAEWLIDKRGIYSMKDVLNIG